MFSVILLRLFFVLTYGVETVLILPLEPVSGRQGSITHPPVVSRPHVPTLSGVVSVGMLGLMCILFLHRRFMRALTVTPPPPRWPVPLSWHDTNFFFPPLSSSLPPPQPTSPI